MAAMIVSVYQHNQDTAAQVWTIAHNLGGCGEGIPAVDVLVTENGVTSKIIPLSVVIIDKNTVEISFSSARTGKAIIAV